MGDEKSPVPMASWERDRELLIPVAKHSAEDPDSKASSSVPAHLHSSGREPPLAAIAARHSPLSLLSAAVAVALRRRRCCCRCRYRFVATAVAARRCLFRCSQLTAFSKSANSLIYW
ncbi:hypothetical protein BHE74_00048471 [Ensete ventricosum]|nr:hypothetical protein BHE74_00048471 [Ensete ventricosum]